MMAGSSAEPWLLGASAFVAGALVGAAGYASWLAQSPKSPPAPLEAPAFTAAAETSGGDVAKLASSGDKSASASSEVKRRSARAADDDDEEDEDEDDDDDDDDDEDEEDDDDDEDEEEEDIPGVPPGELKMLLVVRTDLKMGAGKTAAQCGHATLGVFRRSSRLPLGQAYIRAWTRRGQAKICLRVDNEETMDTVAKAFAERGIATYIVADAGRTQIDPGTRTVLGVGPAPCAMIDEVTGPKGAIPLRLMH